MALRLVDRRTEPELGNRSVSGFKGELRCLYLPASSRILPKVMARAALNFDRGCASRDAAAPRLKLGKDGEETAAAVLLLPIHSLARVDKHEVYYSSRGSGSHRVVSVRLVQSRFRSSPFADPALAHSIAAHDEREKTAEEIAEYRKLQESIYVCAPQIKAYTEMRKRVSGQSGEGPPCMHRHGAERHALRHIARTLTHAYVAEQPANSW